MPATEKLRVVEPKVEKVKYPFKVKMTMTDYHAHEAVGSNSLKRVLRSPAHYKYAIDNPDDPTPAKVFGQHCHEAILEPELFVKNTVVMPKFSGTGSQAKKDAWLMENHGKRIVKAEDMADIMLMIEAVKKNKTAKALLAGGASEESYLDVCPETGLKRKVRPDFLKDGHIIVDVKTTTDANHKEFEKDIANFGYHISAAYYLDVVGSVLGKKFSQSIIIAIEKTPPYGISIHLLDEDTIAAGRFLYKKALRTLAECMAKNQFPGYPDRMLPSRIPQWAFPQEEA